MLILGIDPGTTAIGCALIKMERGQPMLEQAQILAIRSRSAPDRLRELHEALEALIRRAKPDAAAVERLFFTKNAKTAIAVAESRGVILLTAALAGLSVFEYTPLQIKKALTGDGNADKKQVKKMIQLTLRANVPVRAQDDLYDAIAAGLTCCFLERRNWTQSSLS